MELFAFLAACAVSAFAISSLRRFVHAACHASQKRFLCPFILAYAASRHSYFPLTMRSTVSAPTSTASRLVPLLPTPYHAPFQVRR